MYFKTDSYIDGDATHKADTPEELVEYLRWIRTRARPQTKNILQEKIDGFALSTARWWSGRAWVGPYEATLERKKHMAGDVGPSTGCALNAVFFYEEDYPDIARALNWEDLTAEFAAAEAPPGLYDVNALVADGEAWYLEMTPRFGWDSEGTSHRLYDHFSGWLWKVATGAGDAPEPSREQIAASIRLTVPPAPWEYGTRDEKGSAVGVPVNGDVGDLWSGGFMGYELQYHEDQGLTVAAPEGLVGLSIAVGDAMSDLAEEVTDFAKKRLRVPGLQFRVDIGEAIAEDAKTCREEGFDVHPGLEE